MWVRRNEEQVVKFSCRALLRSLPSQISPYLVLARGSLFCCYCLWIFHLPGYELCENRGYLCLTFIWATFYWATFMCPGRAKPLAPDVGFPVWNLPTLCTNTEQEEGLLYFPLFFFAGHLSKCTSRSPWPRKTSSCASGEWPSSL